MHTHSWRLGILPAVALFSLTAPAAAQPVGSEFQVNTYTTGYQATAKDHEVAADANGNFVVVWQGAGSGDADGVFGKRFERSGLPLGNEFRINSYTTSLQWFPSVARDPKGNFVVVWESQFPNGVFAQRFEGSGQPLGSEFRVTSGVAGGPSVASAADGNFVVVWYAYDDDGSWGIFGQLFDRRGRAIGSEFQVESYATGDQTEPSVVNDASGNFVVVWVSDDQDGSYQGVFGQRYDGSGVPKGEEFQVNTFTLGSQQRPSLASAADGGFVAVWESRGDGSGDGVFGQRFDSTGEPQGEEFQVNSYTTGSQDRSSVASDASGNFLVVWESGDGSNDGVFGQRFDSAGVPQGAEFRVNSYTTAVQRSPIAGAIGGDDFIAVWASQRQEAPASSYGVFGKRIRR